MSLFRFALRCGVAGVLAASAPSLATPWDFEGGGGLAGWSNSGTAFWAQPTYGNNVAPRRPGESPGAQGDYWIGTYEWHPNPTAPVGRTQGDGPVGELLSDPFQINTATIDFLIGGGNDIVNERVSLLVKRTPDEPPPGRPDAVRHLPDGDYWTFLSATGRNEEQMYRRVWDVSRWNGRVARILVVDNASGPWGHINVDDFHVHPGLGTAVPVSEGSGGSAVALPPSARFIPRPSVLVPEPGTRNDPLPPPALASGRFRLLATGFFVGHQTVDDMLERDGRGDEIFIRGDWYEYNNGALSNHGRALSGVFGDRSDFRAGSSRPGIFSADDQPGGLITNDSYPVRDSFGAVPARRSGDLPMVLWEGTLDSTSKVVILPSIWEWDDASRSGAEGQWEHYLDIQAPTLAHPSARRADQPFELAGNILSESLLEPLDVHDMGGNRPIGARLRSTPNAAMPVTAVVLTFADAMRASDRTYSFTSTHRNEDGSITGGEYQGPPGAFSIRMVDPSEMEGDYTLYLRLVRVD
jgi:hypothetical protein